MKPLLPTAERWRERHNKVPDWTRTVDVQVHGWFLVLQLMSFISSSWNVVKTRNNYFINVTPEGSADMRRWFCWIRGNVTYISRTMTMSDLPSKASIHWTSLGWWRLFMMPISCRTFSFSFAEYALMNFPAQTFFVAFSISLKTWPNFPLSHKHTFYCTFRPLRPFKSSLNSLNHTANRFKDRLTTRYIQRCTVGEWVGGALRSQPLLHVVQLLHLHVCSDDHVSVVRFLLWVWQKNREVRGHCAGGVTCHMICPHAMLCLLSQLCVCAALS